MKTLYPIRLVESKLSFIISQHAKGHLRKTRGNREKFFSRIVLAQVITVILRNSEYNPLNTI
jgi:hypothetical protein